VLSDIAAEYDTLEVAEMVDLGKDSRDGRFGRAKIRVAVRVPGKYLQ
jgi:hypothetical protein